MLVIGANAEIFELRCVQNCYFLVHLLEMEELWLRLMAISAPLGTIIGTITGVEVIGSLGGLVTGF